MSLPHGRRAPRGHVLHEPLVAVALLFGILVLGARPIAPVIEHAALTDAAAVAEAAILEARARALATGRCHRVEAGEQNRSVVVVRAPSAECVARGKGEVVDTRELPHGATGGLQEPIAFTRDGRLVGASAEFNVLIDDTLTVVRVDRFGRACVRLGFPGLACAEDP